MFFPLVSKNYFAMFKLKLFKIQMTKTSIGLEWKALIEVYIDFINYKEFITPGNENISVFMFHFIYFNRKTIEFHLFYFKNRPREKFAIENKTDDPLTIR